MIKLLLGSFLASVAVFLFGAAYWMSGPTMKLFAAPNQPEAFGKSLLEHLPLSGVYVYPPALGTEAQHDAASRQGPIALIHYHREGMPAMDPTMLVRGFLVIWVTFSFVALLLQLTVPALPTYGSRVLVVVVTGLIVAANSDLGATVWWHHAPQFAGASALYNVLAFLIGGLILAKFVRRPPAPL